MRTTSNPAFKNLPSGGGYANFNYGQGQPAAAGGTFGQAPSAPAQTSRPMTIDDVVTKTAITLAIAVGTGAATYIIGGASSVMLALPAAIVGLVLALVIVFRKKVSPGLVIAYSAVEGVFLGGISYLFGVLIANNPAMIFQAIAATIGVFAGMLVVYKTGAIRVTPKLTKWIIGAVAGVLVLMLLNLVASFFTEGGLGLRDGSPLAIGFSLLCIGIAAFSFLLDFDAADKMIKNGADAKLAWYVAFGLMVTLIWLYIEILRLMSYFQNN